MSEQILEFRKNPGSKKLPPIGIGDIIDSRKSARTGRKGGEGGKHLVGKAGKGGDKEGLPGRSPVSGDTDDPNASPGSKGRPTIKKDPKQATDKTQKDKPDADKEDVDRDEKKGLGGDAENDSELGDDTDGSGGKNTDGDGPDDQGDGSGDSSSTDTSDRNKLLEEAVYIDPKIIGGCQALLSSYSIYFVNTLSKVNQNKFDGAIEDSKRKNSNIFIPSRQSKGGGSLNKAIRTIHYILEDDDKDGNARMRQGFSYYSFSEEASLPFLKVKNQYLNIGAFKGKFSNNLGAVPTAYNNGLALLEMFAGEEVAPNSEENKRMIREYFYLFFKFFHYAIFDLDSVLKNKALIKELSEDDNKSKKKKQFQDQQIKNYVEIYEQRTILAQRIDNLIEEISEEAYQKQNSDDEADIANVQPYINGISLIAEGYHQYKNERSFAAANQMGVAFDTAREKGNDQIDQNTPFGRMNGAPRTSFDNLFPTVSEQASFFEDNQDTESENPDEKDNQVVVPTEPPANERKEYMSKKDIKLLIKEAFTEADTIYGKYRSSRHPLQTPSDDILPDKQKSMIEWKNLCDRISGDPTKMKAVEFCKVLIKDPELMQDILEIIASKPELATIIMNKMLENDGPLQ